MSIEKKVYVEWYRGQGAERGVAVVRLGGSTSILPRNDVGAYSQLAPARLCHGPSAQRGAAGKASAICAARHRQRQASERHWSLLRLILSRQIVTRRGRHQSNTNQHPQREPLLPRTRRSHVFL